jgi:branched-chain amino acid transport system substrate-binding protein
MLKAKIALLATLVTVLSVGASRAEKKYDPGAGNTSIKIGNAMPYSGPNSAPDASGFFPDQVCSRPPGT